MKKLMIAAAVAAMGTGAFAECDEGTDIAVWRAYQMQMNVYTTKGVANTTTSGSGNCDETTTCLVMRGKDKTVFRGYIYVCDQVCELSGYTAQFCDSKRKVLFGDTQAINVSNVDLVWNFINIIGANYSDAEANWNFKGTVNYDANRAQEYTLVGSGYGTFTTSSTPHFDNLTGYFAGTATASFDLKTKGDTACVCQPSKVLKCDKVEGLEFEDSDTIAFGAWKCRFNANVSKALAENKWNPFTALKKAMK